MQMTSDTTDSCGYGAPMGKQPWRVHASVSSMQVLPDFLMMSSAADDPATVQ